MNFDFSEDQKLIQAEARKLLAEQCSPALVRAVMDDQQQPYSVALWKQVVDMGWTATAVPEVYGGLGLGYLELCVLAEELGRAAAPIPFSSTVYLFAEALKLAGSDEQQQQWLPGVASGATIGALAVAGDVGEAVNAEPAARVEAGKLSGRMVGVIDGDVAGAAVVFAQSEQGESLYIVALDQGAVDRQPVEAIDLARSCAILEFDGADCELLGTAGQGRQLLRQLYDRAAVLFAFEQVGGSEAALQMGMDYTQQRYAFGRPVASFQAIKHKFADMYVSKELARSNAYYGAWALSSDAPELPLAAATARVSASAAYDLCSRENLQAHGGMGFTWEFDCHLHYRRAQLLSMATGSARHWRQLLAERLLSTDVSGAQ